MFIKNVTDIVCANCGKKAKTGILVNGGDMFDRTWENQTLGYNCATELFGFSKKIIVLAANAYQEKEEKEKQGWKEKDFATALRKELVG